MFGGAYWGKRPETREQAARRLATFLESLAAVSASLSSWYPKSRRRSKSELVPIRLEANELAALLKSNKKDLDGTSIDELGFNIGLWNGAVVSLGATIGANSEFVFNSVVLAIDPGAEGLSQDVWRRVLEEMIRAFGPEKAAIASNERLRASPAANAWDVGWLTYRQGDPAVVEHAERR